MPKRDDEEALSIRFPKPLAAELRVLAEEEHRSINGTVLEAVERYIRARRGRQTKDNADGR